MQGYIKYNVCCNQTIWTKFQNQFSEIGKTITLPIYNPDEFNIAFCSCSNYPAGFFNAYKEIANNDEIDLVLHLGDYLYEYDENGNYIGSISHILRVFLIDQEKNVRNIYSVSFLHPDLLINDIKTLLDPKTKNGTVIARSAN